MAYRKVREFKQRLRDHVPDDVPRGYYAAVDEGDDVDPPDGQLVTADALARMTGCTTGTVKRFAATGTIPAPIGKDAQGDDLFDLAHPRLAEWIAALQRAGYHQRPAACS